MSQVSSLSKEVNRKIHFYRIESKRDKGGFLRELPTTKLLQNIESIPHGEDRRMRLQDGKSCYCWIRETSARQKLRLSTTRTLDLPPVEHGGDIHPLTIAQGAGLAEMIHVVFFEGNIVGADFNYHGPRLSRLAEYFRKKCESLCPSKLRFETLLNPDVSKALSEDNEIRLFSFRVTRSDIEVVEGINETLGRSLRAQADLGVSGEVGVLLKQEHRKQENIDSNYRDLARDLIGSDVIRDKAKDLTVKMVPPGGSVDTIDLLQDQLLFRSRVLKNDSQGKSIDPESAFSAIEDAYDRNSDEIQYAASIQAVGD